MKEAADFAIYTPGNDSGIRVSTVKSFAAPDKAALSDREAFRDRVVSNAAIWLSPAGLGSDPLRSREHILLAAILDSAWRNPPHLDLTSIIAKVQNPPFTRVGVFDLESFYPAQERFGLAMALNHLLASPVSRPGSPASRSTSTPSSGPETASPASASSPSPTTPAPSAGSSSRCRSIRRLVGCAARAEPPHSGPSCTWTRSLSIPRRSPIHRRRSRF